MKLLRLLPLFALFPFSGSAQFVVPQNVELLFRRAGKVWVANDDPDKEQQLLSANTALKRLRFNNVALFIPAKPVKIVANGNRYLRAFLVNASADTVEVPREDSTLGGMKMDVSLNGTWKLLQRNQPSTCGNSYWTMKLAPGHYVPLEIEDPGGKGTAVSCRVSVTVNGAPVFSNVIRNKIPADLVNAAGTPINF